MSLTELGIKTEVYTSSEFVISTVQHTCTAWQISSSYSRTVGFARTEMQVLGRNASGFTERS